MNTHDPYGDINREDIEGLKENLKPDGIYRETKQPEEEKVDWAKRYADLAFEHRKVVNCIYDIWNEGGLDIVSEELRDRAEKLTHIL